MRDSAGSAQAPAASCRTRRRGSLMALPYRNAQHHAREQRPASTARQANDHPAKRSGRRGERLSLLHDIGDENDALGVAGLAPRMGRFGRYVEAIAFFEHAGRLTLYGKLE